MGLMDLLGDDNSRNDFRDFSDRFERGAPWDGFDDREAFERHERVASHLDDDEYERHARSVVERLSPDERRALGRELAQRGRSRGMDFDDRDDRYDDPGQLSGMVGRVRRQSPGGLGDLLGGGGGGGGLGGMLGGGGGGGLGGMMSGGGGGDMGGALGKVLMGGIAAMAARQVLGGR